jgi:hypothetical protein
MLRLPSMTGKQKQQGEELRQMEFKLLRQVLTQRSE